MKYYLKIISGKSVNTEEYRNVDALINDFIERMAYMITEFISISNENGEIFFMDFRNDSIRAMNFRDSIACLLIEKQKNINYIHYNEIGKKFGYSMLVYLSGRDSYDGVRIFFKEYLKKLLLK